jgi:hypothetical protein
VLRILRSSRFAISFEENGTLETAQKIADHEPPRARKLHNKTHDELTLDGIKKILSLSKHLPALRRNKTGEPDIRFAPEVIADFDAGASQECFWRSDRRSLSGAAAMVTVIGQINKMRDTSAILTRFSRASILVRLSPAR